MRTKNFIRRILIFFAIILVVLALLTSTTKIARFFFHFSVNKLSPYQDQKEHYEISTETMPEYIKYTGIINHVRFANQQGSAYRISIIKSDLSEEVFYLTDDDVRKTNVHSKNVITEETSEREFNDLESGQVIEIEFYYSPRTFKPINFADHAPVKSVSIYILEPQES